MRSLLRDEIVAGLAGALIVAAVEVAHLQPRPALAAVVLILFLGLGLAIGAAMLASEYAVHRLRLRPATAALVRAAPALIALVPVGNTLFEGGMASTLPGARWAPYWFPAAGVTLLWLAIWLGRRAILGRLWLHGEIARGALAALLVIVTLLVELANRRLFPSLYPRVHTMLVVVACASLAVALRLWLVRAPVLAPRLARRLRLGCALATAALLAAALPLGMSTPGDRWTVTTRGNHARHLAAMARTLVDLDRDGFSPVLGGGDCDDLDGGANPGQRDRPQNGIDEDCDGMDAEPLPPRSIDPERRRDLAELAASPAARALADSARDHDLLLLSIDALRADILAPTDESRRQFPNLTRLLEDSRWFTNAVAPASGTDVSLSSLVTGRVDPFVRIDTTLFEALERSGRSTYALLPREVLRWAPRRLLLRGLRDWDRVVNDREQRNVGAETTSVVTTRRASRFLARLPAGERYALWVHYFDVHEHHQVQPGDRELVRLGADVTTAEGKYRALLMLIDREVGRLLEVVRDRGRADQTVIVLFSDHGESLGEDPRLPDNHGLYVYRPLTAIPMAIRVPGVAPARIDEPVSLIDLFPTLAELLSLEPPEGIDGESLFLHLLGDAPEMLYPGRALVLNESEQWGVIQWPHKLMYRPTHNLMELYDLSADPGEQNNLARAEPELVRRLKQRYMSFPEVSFDRSFAGRRWRQQQARPPRRR